MNNPAPRRQALAACLLLLGLCSCMAPLMERARDPVGWSGGAGLEVGGGYGPNIDLDGGGTALLAGPVGQIRYGLNDRTSFSLRGGYGRAFSSNPTPNTSYYEARLSAKWPVADNVGLKLTEAVFGFPGPQGGHLFIEELDLLDDLSEFTTGYIGFGYPTGCRLGVIFHPRISRRLIAHVSLSNMDVLGGGIGLGLDWAHEDTNSNRAGTHPRQ